MNRDMYDGNGTGTEPDSASSPITPDFSHSAPPTGSSHAATDTHLLPRVGNGVTGTGEFPTPDVSPTPTEAEGKPHSQPATQWDSLTPRMLYAALIVAVCLTATGVALHAVADHLNP